MIYVQLNPQKEIAKKCAFKLRSKCSHFQMIFDIFPSILSKKCTRENFSMSFFFFFFPTRESCFPKIAYLIIEFPTHNTQNKENNNCQETLVLA